MSFKIRKIKKTRPDGDGKIKMRSTLIDLSDTSKKIPSVYHRRKDPGKAFNAILGVFLSLLGIAFVCFITIQVYAFIRNVDLKGVLAVMGTELQKNEAGYTNILLLGSGGRQHESPDLTDTIIVASIDTEQNTVSMLSIPRDLHVKQRGCYRINEVYRNNKIRLSGKLEEEENFIEKTAITSLQKIIEDITDVNIHYFIKVDFTALEEIVDAVGGIDIYVEQTINDPLYPTKNWTYQKFYLRKGLQHLDGQTALKYARSRHSTSDFDRSRRQQKVIFAIKDAAVKNGIVSPLGVAQELITGSGTILSLYDAMKKNVVTNLEIAEILTLAKLSVDFKQKNLVSKVLVDDPNYEGGFLFTPKRTEDTDPAILVPYKNNYYRISDVASVTNLGKIDFEHIQLFADLIFQYRQMYIEPDKLEILNGTGDAGLAGKIFRNLQRFGFVVEEVSNTRDKEKFSKTLVINYQEKTPDTFEVLKNILPALYINDLQSYIEKLDTKSPLREKLIPYLKQTEGIDITIILGGDYDIKLINLT